MSTDLMAVDVLSDETMLKILHLTSGKEISLTDISISCDITGAACLRRVQDLIRSGFLREVSPTPDNISRRYTSSIERIEVQFKDGLMYCKVERRGGKEDMDCLDPISGLHPQWNGYIDHSDPKIPTGIQW